MDNRFFEGVVEHHKGSKTERDAKAYYSGNWDQLDSFAKFTWLAFAERRSKRDI